MLNAIIDIGSNTIRFVVYDGTNEVENFADYAGLIAEVNDGKISSVGVGKLISSLTKMKLRAQELKCENIYAFATASLRGITDSKGLISLIKDMVGIEIELISGEAEAEYGCSGIKIVNGIQEGVAFDLGGGSCEVMVFNKDSLLESASLPIGSLKLHSDLVSGVLPNETERCQICSVVKNSLSNLTEFCNCGYKSIYGTGGAVWAVKSLITKYIEKTGAVTFDNLQKVIVLSETEVNEVVPKRLKSVIPACITMIELLNTSGAHEIIPTSGGVRDGIVYDKILQKEKLHK